MSEDQSGRNRHADPGSTPGRGVAGGRAVPDGVVGAVLEAVADARDAPVESLTTPLYEAVDPEAVEALFVGGRGHVEFEYEGVVVRVAHDRTVTARRADSS
ncbi:HalOD1 output domain-containing protein [Halobaculum litoreum]|uniref:HalOD1 output domain-containing protein n=1 Tax=Halobaculum litoreum TaxID=3031998 RepID=A0ABD5XWC0_9EURY|nr:HalOD1 output domain-containing protein [Halobaculum sp. DT92]